MLFWEKSKDVAVCPITELGFVRVVCRVYGVTMTDARRILGRWKHERQARFIPCDISALDGMPPVSGEQSTDIYLCNLAAKHGMKLAAQDQRIKHPAVELIKN